MLPPIKIPEHLSVSQLRTFIGCGYRWVYEHQDGVIRQHDRGWDNRLRGQCLDNAVSTHFRAKADNGIGITVSQIKELVAAEHDEYEDITMFNAIQPEKSKDRLVTQAALYHETFGAMFRPRSIEDVQRQYTYHDSDLAVPVVGIVDAIMDIPLIVDTKIKKRVPFERDVHNDWQLTTYAMMANIPNVALAIITDEKYPRAELIQSIRTPDQVKAMKVVYNQVWKSILSAVFLPAAEGYFLCNEKYCPHFANCPMGGKNAADTFSIPGMNE